jgi:2-keto-3-deoxy-L-fuconate dehydrogenase
VAQRLADKKAFVTGAGAGIGQAIARAFAEEGAFVIATDVVPHGLADLADLERVTTTLLDVSDGQAIADLARTVGTVDVLANVAAVVHDGSVLDCDDDEWDRSFAVNAKSVHRTIRAFAPGMIAQGSGSIINISSTHGLSRGGPNRYAYSATKGAVAALTRAVATDLSSTGVRCNCIAPGPVRSPSLLNRIAASLEPTSQPDEQVAAALAAMEKTHVLGRFGETAEVASMAVYLASDESSYTNGAQYVVDGGWSL